MTLSVKDICERYRVSGGTVRAWVKAGLLRGIDVSRRQGSKKPRLRFTESAVATFEMLRSPTPPAPSVRRKRLTDSAVMDFIK